VNLLVVLEGVELDCLFDFFVKLVGHSVLNLELV